MDKDDAAVVLAKMNTVLTRWEPENRAFWAREGGRIARRNLALSIPPLVLSFAVWGLWSTAVVYLPYAGFGFTTDELFWLAALPALCGATLRIFYSFLVPIFGGRRWTTISTALLLLPTLGFGIAVQEASTSYGVFVVLALLCGFGGGNFASSMSNINFFFPISQKGTALGLNAGLGNLGVSLVQFVVPLVVAAGIFGALGGEPQAWGNGTEARQMWLQNAGYVWVPFIVASAIAAWFGMNDLATAKASFGEQAVIFRRRQTWLMCWLYLGTFGSFIGYSAGFPLLIKTQFPQVNALNYAWLGPLLGALIRPVGGWLADQLGGARVTFWVFVAMAFAVCGVLAFLPSGTVGGNFHAFLAMFMVLFLAAGIGNGSVFRMVPVVFLTERGREAKDKGKEAQERAVRSANTEAAAVLGFSSALGAYGGFFIPKSYGTSIALTGDAEAALYTFVVFYVCCVAITWWYYARPKAAIPC